MVVGFWLERVVTEQGWQPAFSVEKTAQSLRLLDPISLYFETVFEPKPENLNMKNLLLGLVLSLFAIPAFATVHTVLADNFFYDPAFLTVDPGDTIRFEWVVGNHPTSSTTGPWSSAVSFPLNSSATTFDLVLTTPGTYDYICDFHIFLGMVGTIVVNDPPCSAPPTTPFVTVVPSAINIGWDPPTGAIGCEVSGGPVGAGFPGTARVISSFPDGISIPTSLAPGNYEVRVRCVCSLSPLLPSPYSAVTTFTVTAPKLANELPEMDAILSPNPATDQALLRYQLENAGQVNIQIVDLLGQVHSSEQMMADAGKQQFSLDLSRLENGQYLLNVSAEGAEQTISFSVVK